VTYDTLLFDRSGGEGEVGLLKLNRPEVLNAMNTQMGRDLRDAFRGLRDDERLRCLVLTGAGDRAFCTGADLKERNRMTDEEFFSQHRIFEDALLEGLRSIPVPVVAAVEGYCLAGGFELALGCDLIVASEAARFGLTETTRGLMPGVGAVVHLPRLAGKTFTKDVVFTARLIPGEEALRRGVVSRLTAPGQALGEALAMARTIADNAPVAVRQAKKAIERGMDCDVGTALAFMLEAYHAVVGTEDRREGIVAFNEKRAPRFAGR